MWWWKFWVKMDNYLEHYFKRDMGDPQIFQHELKEQTTVHLISWITFCSEKLNWERVPFFIDHRNLNFLLKAEKKNLQNMQHYMYRHRKACLSKQPPWRAAGHPCLARGRSRVRAPGPAGAHGFFFSTLLSFLLREIVFLHLPHQTRKSVRVKLIVCEQFTTS